MTEFPAKAMTVQEWTIARQHEVFIPIDYSANLTSILCAVTWAALMKGGIAIIAKFKAFTTQDDDNACEHPLPSWVIDWRLAARLFRRNASIFGMSSRALENTWAKLGRDGHLGLVPGHPPGSQEQFCQDNGNSTVPYTKLILRGMVAPRFRVEGKSIWEKRRWLTDKAVWQLECDVYPTDIVVHMLGFIRCAGYGLSLAELLNDNTVTTYQGGGLWLLRPAGDDEFKLIACLPFSPKPWYPLYPHWEWNPGYFWEAPSQAQPVDHYRRFATDPEIQKPGYHPSFYAEDSTEVRKFTII